MRSIPLLVLLLAAPAAPVAAQPAGPAVKAIEVRRLYAILLALGPEWKPGKPFHEQGLRSCFDCWMGFYRSGRTAAAGPPGDDSGLVLLLARGQADAEAVMRADRVIVAGMFRGSVRSYAPAMIDIEALTEVRNDGRN
jgi:hypothetical protein